MRHTGYSNTNGDLQCRSSLNTKLTVEHQDRLLARVAARRRFRLACGHAEEELLDARGRVDVDGARDVSPVILIVEPTVNDMELLELRVVDAVEQIVELNGIPSASDHLFRT